jgi:hypothetical protein
LHNIRSAPFIGDDLQSHCLVTIRNRDSRDSRVSFMAFDGNGDIAAALSGE